MYPRDEHVQDEAGRLALTTLRIFSRPPIGLLRGIFLRPPHWHRVDVDAVQVLDHFFAAIDEVLSSISLRLDSKCGGLPFRLVKSALKFDVLLLVKVLTAQYI